MQLTNKGKTFAFIALLSALFSYLVITFDFFPHFGLSLWLVAFAIFSYSLKTHKSIKTKLYLIFTLTFSLMIAVRSEEFTTFLNFVSALFFGSLMLTSSSKNKLGFIEHAVSPVVLIFKSLFEKSDYYFEYVKTNKKNPSKLSETIIGVFISIAVLAVILPLLSFSNPIFEKTMSGVWQYLNLSNYFKDLNYEDLFKLLVRFAFFIGGIFVIPKMLTLSNKDLSDFDFISLKNVHLPLLIPKLMTAVVIAVFVIMQIQLYLAAPQTLDNMGITLSQRSREVFAHLSIVTGIIFALVYNTKKANAMSQLLSSILLAESIFLIFIAYKSVFDYIFSWGFTQKRLYGVMVATFLLTILIMFIRDNLKKISMEQFAQKAVLTLGVFLLAINILNFDYLIYHFKKSSTGQGVDYFYLSGLSPDSQSYKEQLGEADENYISKNDKGLAIINENYPMRLIWKIDDLQQKYEKNDFRSWNLLDYLEYKKIKDIDTEKYINMFSNLYVR